MDLKRPPRWQRILKRLMVGMAGLTIVAIGAGYLWQRAYDARVLEQHPAPGSFVTVQGRRLHYRLIGSGEVTFIFEAGLGNYSDGWQRVEPELAKIGRVLLYDRAGLGWSEAASTMRSASQVASELHDLLGELNLGKPRVLVGRSLGGLTALRYVVDYPGEAAGLLLLDPSHPQQVDRLPNSAPVLTRLAPVILQTAPFGLPHLLFPSGDPLQNLSRHASTTGKEFAMLYDSDRSWLRPGALGPTPIVVLTAGDDSRFPGENAVARHAAWTIWNTMHDEMVAASTSDFRQNRVLAGATHQIHATHPNEVARAARELVEAIRRSGR